MDPKSIPAYPVSSDNYANPDSTGMALRDHFAGLAMQVFLANTESSFASDAKNAYAMADAMLAAR